MRSINKTIFLDKKSPILNPESLKGRVVIKDELERYIYNCGMSLSNVNSAVEKTVISIEYISNSHKVYDENSDFSADRYIEYSIENFFIRSHSIYEMVLILVNRILNLGISNESINHEMIVTNEHVKEAGLNDHLKKLRKVATGYRLERNQIVHHGSYSEEKLDRVSLMHQTNHLQSEIGQEPLIPVNDVANMTQELVDTQVKEFEKHIDKINNSLDIFLVLAEKVYLTKRNSF